MRYFLLGLLGIVGGLAVTVGFVKVDAITDYVNTRIAGVITDAEAQQIYYNVVRASGQSSILPRMEIINSSVINAATSSSGIYLYRGLLNLVDKDELALILGHEISHYVLGHVFIPFITQTKDNVRVEEMQADKYGAVLMMRAGYDICKGRAFFNNMKSANGDNMDLDHPDYAFRYDQLNINCGG